MLSQPPFEHLIFSALKSHNLAPADAFAIQANLPSIQRYLLDHYWDCLVEHILAAKKDRMTRLLKALASPGYVSGCFSCALVDGADLLYISDEGLDAIVSDRLISYIQNHWLKFHPAWAAASYTAWVETLTLSEILAARSKHATSPYQLSLF
jgi:hypothetical protein